MKIRFLGMVLAALVLLAAAPSRTSAGGPYSVSADGRPYRYDATQPVRYVVDAGPLGPRSHAAAVAMLQQAFRIWESVPTSRLRFQPTGELPQDIDAKNVLAFLNGLKPGDPSPVLFDSDGSIAGELLGAGATEANYGYAMPWWGDPHSGQILTSFALLNGAFLALYRDDYALQACVHELGHFIGLEHSQINPEVLYDGDPTNDDLAPAMSYFWGPNSRGHLHREDEAWLSWLYPTPEFAAQTGTIRGRVLLPDRATGLMGVNVIARRVGDRLSTAVSGISGYLFGRIDDALRDPGRPGEFRQIKLKTNAAFPDGVSDPARLGEFLIPGLPPGSYTLELAPVTEEPLVSHRGYLVGGPKFWREGSSAGDPPAAFSSIPVNAGCEVSVDIVVNGQDPGEPRVVLEEPNSWDQPQVVERLPAEIRGGVQGDRGVSVLLNSIEELDDAYVVQLQEWTTVTAILSAAQPTTDLDLYLVSLVEASVVSQATAPGTPPEVLQERLPPGRYVFGVYHAGGPGSAYTLRLLATPSPDPAEKRDPPRINYLILGDITETGATARWQTTGDAASVLYYGTPFHEIGSTLRGQEHSLALTDLAPSSRVNIQVWSAPETWAIGTFLVTARQAALLSPPQIATESGATWAPSQLLGRDAALASVRLSNTGDGNALNVRIETVTPAPGWEALSEALLGSRLPGALTVGRIGAGGRGYFGVFLLRRSGSADPAITIHGSYTDAAGTARTF